MDAPVHPWETALRWSDAQSRVSMCRARAYAAIPPPSPDDGEAGVTRKQARAAEPIGDGCGAGVLLLQRLCVTHSPNRKAHPPKHPKSTRNRLHKSPARVDIGKQIHGVATGSCSLSSVFLDAGQVGSPAPSPRWADSASCFKA